MAIKISVPRSWKTRVKSSMLHAVSLARHCVASIQGRAATTDRPLARLQQQVDQLEHENSLLREEMRIKNARMSRLAPHRRPYYVSIERMAILELRAARGWTAAETAKRFQITENTISNWMRRLDEQELTLSSGLRSRSTDSPTTSATSSAASKSCVLNSARRRSRSICAARDSRSGPRPWAGL